MHDRKPSVEHERIKRLEDELSEMRQVIIDLMRQEVRKILVSYYTCLPSEEGMSWLSDVVRKIMELVKSDSLHPTSYSADRACCPLCGDEGSDPYGKGFTMEGLRRHLEGRSNVHQCEVTRAAFKLAQQHWDERKERPW